MTFSLDSNKWWTYDLPSGDKLVHVSSSTGNDVAGDGSIGNPYATAAKGITMLTNNSGDHLLFKCGDNWNENLQGLTGKNGRSATERIIVSSYGTGARPKFNFAGGHCINASAPSAKLKNMMLEDLECYYSAWAGFGNGKFLRGLYLEDFSTQGMYIHDCSDGINSGTGTTGSPKTCFNLDFRYNLFEKCYSVGTEGHGNFIDFTDGYTSYRNGFIQCGWDGTTFNPRARAQYITQRNLNTSIEEPFVLEDSSDQQNRSGGPYKIGYHEQCPGFLNHGWVSGGGESDVERATGIVGNVENNVLITSVLTEPEAATAADTMGIAVANVKSGTGGVTISGNIIAFKGTSDIENNGHGIFLDSSNYAANGLHDVIVEDNIVYDWGRDTLRIHTVGSTGVIIRNNNIQGMSTKNCVIIHTPSDVTGGGVVLSGNNFHAPNLAVPSNFLLDNGSPPGPGIKTFSQYQSTYEPTATNNAPSQTKRDIASYMTAIGEAGGYSGFKQKMRDNRKSSYDYRFTALAVVNYVRAGVGLPQLGSRRAGFRVV